MFIIKIGNSTAFDFSCPFLYHWKLWRRFIVSNSFCIYVGVKLSITKYFIWFLEYPFYSLFTKHCNFFLLSITTQATEHLCLKHHSIPSNGSHLTYTIVIWAYYQYLCDRPQTFQTTINIHFSSCLRNFESFFHI